MTEQTDDTLMLEAEGALNPEPLHEGAVSGESLRRLQLARQMASIRAKWQERLEQYRSSGDTYFATIRCGAYLA